MVSPTDVWLVIDEDVCVIHKEKGLFIGTTQTTVIDVFAVGGGGKLREVSSS